MMARTPRDVMSASKKLSNPLENGDLTAIEPFLAPASVEYKPESLSMSELGAKTVT